MANFVDPWNTATPAGTDARSAGDDRIRELKRALVERYTLEHEFDVATGAGNGRHKFPRGNTASRPTDVTAGAIYINTQTGDLEVYDGAAWVAAGNYLLKSGGTLTGALTLAADPASALQAATKQYVDAFAACTVVSSSGQLTLTTTDTVIPGCTTSALATGNYIVQAHVEFDALWVQDGGPCALVAKIFRNGSLIDKIVKINHEGTDANTLDMETEFMGSIAKQAITSGQTWDLRASKEFNTGTHLAKSARLYFWRVA